MTQFKISLLEIIYSLFIAIIVCIMLITLFDVGYDD